MLWGEGDRTLPHCVQFCHLPNPGIHGFPALLSACERFVRIHSSAQSLNPRQHYRFPQ